MTVCFPEGLSGTEFVIRSGRVCPFVVVFFVHLRSSLERLVEADGGGAVEDDVDAAGEPLHVLRADGQARLHQLAADGDDLPVEVGVVLAHAVKKLQTQKKEGFRGEQSQFK